MESALVSWQVENFSSAELNSPPVSPSPPSPSLYNGIFDKTLNNGKVIVPQSSSSRAQLASSILNDLEQLGSAKMEMNDFGMNWNEESINLGLFEELEEIEYTPPASPKRSLTVTPTNRHNLSEYSIVDNFQLHSAQLNNPVVESSDISALTAEFQAILESLPKDSTDAFSQVFEIAGIPTTVIDGEALVEVELDLSNITSADLQSLNMEVDDLSINAMSDDESNIIDESELYGMSDMSNHGSPASSVRSNYEYEYITEVVVDQHSDAAQKILDALLVGDVSTAESFLPNIVAHDESSMSSEDSYAEVSRPLPIASTSAVVKEVKKPERRGRKPGKKLAKGSLAYVRDKTLRKKEQNKTAATRYRQKKKMEISIILDAEGQAQQEHDELEKKRDDLEREIKMVKQLLREVIKARKPVTGKGSSILLGGAVSLSLPSNTARNRRK